MPSPRLRFSGRAARPGRRSPQAPRRLRRRHVGGGERSRRRDQEGAQGEAAGGHGRPQGAREAAEGPARQEARDLAAGEGRRAVRAGGGGGPGPRRLRIPQDRAQAGDRRRQRHPQVVRGQGHRRPQGARTLAGTSRTPTSSWRSWRGARRRSCPPTSSRAGATSSSPSGPAARPRPSSSPRCRRATASGRDSDGGSTRSRGRTRPRPCSSSSPTTR